jgi:hypothetical protein
MASRLVALREEQRLAVRYAFDFALEDAERRV